MSRLKWKKDSESIITAYYAEQDGYLFRIVAANSRCVVLRIGPDIFGPYSSMKQAKQFADAVAIEIARETAAQGAVNLG